MHFDHFDRMAKKVLYKRIPVFCQPADQKKIESWGFHNVFSIEETFQWGEIDFRRISGHHAKGIVSILLGPVSGYILSTPEDGSLYIVGNCIYTEQISTVIKQYKPRICIVNVPRAQLILGTIITMTPKDIIKILNISPLTKIIAAVHMDAISHCTSTRKDLYQYLETHHALDSVIIPKDGELIYI